MYIIIDVVQHRNVVIQTYKFIMTIIQVHKNLFIVNPIDHYVAFKKANCDDNSYLQIEVLGTNVLLKEFDDCNEDYCMPELHDTHLWTIKYV